MISFVIHVHGTLVFSLSSRPLLTCPFFSDFREEICDHIKLTLYNIKDIDTLWEVVPEFQDTGIVYI